MATVLHYKETALPSTLQPNSIYFIAPSGSPELLEVFVTNAAGTAARRVINREDVQEMVNATIAASNELIIVSDIAARNALAPTTTRYAYVVDATGDPTVSSGGATYLYNPATSSWLKTSEAESLDLATSWESIAGRPTSTPAQIDSAVAASHTHANKTQLDAIGQNAAGEMTYNGVQVKTEWASTAW